MYIAWDYLDKKSAAVSALKDFTDMEHIIQNTPAEITDARETMTTGQSYPISDMPRAKFNPRVNEDFLISQIDEIDILKERYRRALDFMAWFTPAWNELTEDERFILQEFFIRDGISKTTAILNIGDRIHVERAQVYRYKDKAIARLALLLFGK